MRPDLRGKFTEFQCLALQAVFDEAGLVGMHRRLVNLSAPAGVKLALVLYDIDKFCE